jgi:ABC-type protease/lipase transport system fused ATPase/permease subunit
MQALSKVELIDWFQTLDSGLQTRLTPEGLGLPGHIRRRLMLARNFAGNPGLVLVEDNALAQGEDDRQLFYNLLFKHCQGITTIVVSNDPKIAQRCTRTLILENGTLTQLTKQP